MCTYIIFFRTSLPSADSKCLKCVKVVQKQLGMNKFVRTKSPTRGKFSQIFFEQLYTGWIVVVHLYCSFSLWRQMAPQQSAKVRTAFFGQFCVSLRKDSVANYASNWALYSTSVIGSDALCNTLNILHIRL